MDMRIITRMIREIFSDKDSRLSSKRIAGTISLAFSFCLTIYVLKNGYDTNVLMYPYTLTGGLLGLGVLEKKK